MIVISTTGEVDLTLDGVSISNTTRSAINGVNADMFNLVLASGTINTLVDGTTYSDTSPNGTIFSNDTLGISGSGALDVTGNYKHAIVSDDDLIISSGVITITSSVTDGFHATDDVTITDGTINILYVGSDGFESEGTLTMNGGTFDLAVDDDEVMSADTLTVNDGTITITWGVEGIESKNNLIVNDGDISIAVSDDGFNAANDITINGGRFTSMPLPMPSIQNGTMNFHGGVTVALGGNTPEGALDCDSCNINFTGGKVVATGGSNSTPSSSSTQRVVVFNNARLVGTVIHIVNSYGTDVLTFKVNKAYSQMIFTSASLLANTSHTVYTGGTVSGGTEFHGLYTGSIYSGGSVWTTFMTNSVVTYVGGGGPP